MAGFHIGDIGFGAKSAYVEIRCVRRYTVRYVLPSSRVRQSDDHPALFFALGFKAGAKTDDSIMVRMPISYAYSRALYPTMPTPFVYGNFHYSVVSITVSISI